MVCIFLLGFAFVASISAAATCYYADGSEDTSFNQVPCNTSATVSSCCSQNDYCLSNGLCFDAGGNNLLAVESCTDPSWSAPCHAYCPNVIALGNNLFPCANTEPSGGGSVKYCCGHMGTNVTTCCQNGGAFSVPVGQIVLRPDQLSSYLSTSTTPPSTPPTSGPTSSGSSSPPASPGSSNTKSLAIGLGVGVPVALLLVGALIFLGLQLRRQNSNRMMPTGQLPPMALYQPAVELAGGQKPIVGSELEGRNQAYEMAYQRNY